MSWTKREVIKHQFFDALMLIGMRDRLRCPKCSAVGTWKPHGGWCDRLVCWWTDFKSKLKPGVRYATERRWLCKYCGYCRSLAGEVWAYPNKASGVWDVLGADSALTPKQAVEDFSNRAWPWRG